MADVRIQMKNNGPFVVSGPARFVDANGDAFDLKGKEVYALCRCAASASQPFCDGNHGECGFETAETAGEA